MDPTDWFYAVPLPPILNSPSLISKFRELNQRDPVRLPLSFIRTSIITEVHHRTGSILFLSFLIASIESQETESSPLTIQLDEMVNRIIRNFIHVRQPDLFPGFSRAASCRKLLPGNGTHTRTEEAGFFAPAACEARGVQAKAHPSFRWLFFVTVRQTDGGSLNPYLVRVGYHHSSERMFCGVQCLRLFLPPLWAAFSGCRLRCPC